MNVSYNVRWYDDEQTIVLADYPDNWTWDDFYLIREEVHQLMDTSDAPRLDFVADMTNARMPKGSPFTHAMTITRHKHPRTHFIVIVSQQGIIRTMTQMGIRLSPANTNAFRLADTIEDAVARIYADRERVDA